MKKVKALISTAFAIILLAGISFSPMQSNNATAQSSAADKLNKKEACGICVTPSGNWPYPDFSSDVESENCTDC